ncbi:MAG: leucine-rich repeat domain-containing protein [Butyrivibrio sp.]|nr:leucine-rich repeat domain-containing protein [Butyrivibrio sp.]
MPFLFEKKEHNKDAHKYIEITGFEGTAGDLVVPAQIEGLPVEVIGNHSFSGRQDLKSVTLPETIKTLYGFAFHNCRNLKKISLFDSIDDYYDGVCRQCDSLSEIDITINRSWFEVIRNFLADNDRTLHFTVRVSQGSADYVTSSLTFPEYVYDFNENTMARTIQFSIAGSGMFYRECVDRRSINYREYDKLFEKAKIDGGSISEDIAVGRLLYPVELDDRYRLMYEEYVAGSGLSILKRYIEGAKDDPASAVNMIRELLRYSGEKELISRGAIDEAISCSVELGLTEVTAILMESGSGAGSEKSVAMRFEF